MCTRGVHSHTLSDIPCLTWRSDYFGLLVGGPPGDMVVFRDLMFGEAENRRAGGGGGSTNGNVGCAWAAGNYACCRDNKTLRAGFGPSQKKKRHKQLTGGNYYFVVGI